MANKSEPSNIPLKLAIKRANEAIRAGFIIYQKFTRAGCGARLTIDEPNTFHTTGSCDKCPAITDIRQDGCGFMAVLHPDPHKHK